MPRSPAADRSFWPVFFIFLKLGLTSFGGPVAHLAYFHDEFVTRRQWLTARSYADVVALCQFLPGPASSQVGIALGLSRAGYRGALAAWTGFTLPSALVMLLLGLGIAHHHAALPPGVLHGLKVVAVAVIAQAVWGMARTLCPDVPRITLMAAMACVTLAAPAAWSQAGVIAASALLGLRLCKPPLSAGIDPLPLSVSRRTGALSLCLFAVLLVGLPLLAQLHPDQTLLMADAFYRVGSLVFGGGHVVLPLLQAEVVPRGWVNNDIFLAGYGAAQALPGPLFTFSAFLGAAMNTQSSGVFGGAICLLAIFTPSFLLVTGVLPYWERLRRSPRMQAALCGVNAGVVGLLLAALYQPVWTSAILTSQDFGLAICALTALMFWKLPPWLVVLTVGAVGGWLSL